MVAADRSVDPDASLSRYLRKIRQLPLLSAEEELDLAVRWRDQQEVEAAQKLVTAHMRLVPQIAARFRGYGLPLSDLIGVGSVGLMLAVRRYDPERGARFATYAVWWIRAAVQDHVLRTRSLVKMGTTPAQRTLFFNLARLKAEMHVADGAALLPRQIAQIAARLHVAEPVVVEMEHRLAASDYSLNTSVGADGGDELQDFISDDGENQETVFAEREELDSRRLLLPEALRILTQRERQVLLERRMQDQPTPLRELSQRFGLSRQRISQIEVKALAKVRGAMQAQMARREQALAAATTVAAVGARAAPAGRPARQAVLN